jgi:hypothetical protein
VRFLTVMLAPFVVGADTNLNGAKSGPSPGLARLRLR